MVKGKFSKTSKVSKYYENDCSYKLVKFLVPKLPSIMFNEFTVKDSFVIAEEILHQDCKLFMGSLDVDSLFTNKPLE